MENFGDDVVHRIFSKMPAMSLGYCSSVCKHWHSIIDNSPALWRGAYLRGKSRKKASVVSDYWPALERFQQNGSSTTGSLGSRWKACVVAQEQWLRFAYGPATARTWKGHGGRVTCSGLLMDRIASGSADRKIRIWSVNSLRCLEEYVVPCLSSVVDLKFDEAKVISAAGTEAYIWSRGKKGRLLKRMGAGNQRIHSLCVIDSELATGCADGSIRMFDIYSGQCSQIFRHHTGEVSCLAMENFCQILASGSEDGNVQLCDAECGRQVACLQPDSSRAGITCLQITPNGHYIHCGTTSGNIYCLDMRNLKLSWSQKVSTNEVTCMHQQPYGAYLLVVGGVDGVLRALSSTTGELLSSYKRTEYDQPIRLETADSSTWGLPTKKRCRQECGMPIPPSQAAHHAGSPFQQKVRTAHTHLARGPLLTSPPLLSVKMGLTHAITTHSDSSVTLWHFGAPRSL